MNSFALTLKEIQLDQNYLSAKKMYDELHRKGLSCNYQYFMKCLNGDIIPSAAVALEISQTIGGSNAEKLILTYCQLQFPKFKHLFIAKPPTKKKIKENQVVGKKELSLKQVSVIGKSKDHYYLFLTLSLAREEVLISELNVAPSIVDEFVKNKIAVINNSYISAIATDCIFPEDKGLAVLYKSLDQWDLEFSEKFNFSQLIKKTHIRRISWRYLSLIDDHLKLLLNTINSSDEIDPIYNNEVIHFQVMLSAGKIPG